MIHRTRTKASSILLVILATIFLIVLVRTAWLCDDAFITFRTVDNFVNGYGFRWNVSERVQSFTHPLWMLLFTAVYAFTHEPYFTSLAISIVVSLAAFVLYGWWIPSSLPALAVGTVMLLCSKAFIDYSTSGLENPLTHFLLIVLLAAWTRKTSSRAWQLAFWAAVGLSLSNRHDLVTLLLPPVLAELWRAHDRRSIGIAILGIAPFAAWELFSVVYYGFALPNTAYAKLNTGVEQAALWAQGGRYYLDTLRRDPVTLMVIGLSAALALGSRATSTRPLAVGLLAYATYVLSIGGDNMTGRFLTAPFVLSVGMITQWPWPRRAVLAPVAAAAVFAAAAASGQPLPFATGAEYGVGEAIEIKVDLKTGIDDERRWYYPDTGLLRVRRAGSTPTHEWVQMGRGLRASGAPVAVSGFVGFEGFYAGPGVYIIDCHALADPLLARLPADRYWRTGHFARRLPEGYAASRTVNQNALTNPQLRSYYAYLEDITRGEIWTAKRFETILKMNTGAFEDLLTDYTAEASACDDIIGLYKDILWK